jgi:hypothetical protein
VLKRRGVLLAIIFNMKFGDMKLLLAAGILFALLSGSLCFSAENKIEGKVQQMTYGPDARPDGFVLDDHTVVRFRSNTFPSPEAITPGDLVSVNGVQVLTQPNRVFDQVVVKKGELPIVTDTAAGTTPQVVPGQSDNYEVMKDKSSLLAVSAAPDGRIDRLILSDGTTVEIPPFAEIDPSHLKLGEKISAQGTGLSFEDINFIRAMNVGSSSVTSLLQPRGGKGKWVSKTGVIRQVLLTPQGDIDGVLLKDNSAIRFPPSPSNRASILVPGVEISTAGAFIGDQIHTETILFSHQSEKDKAVINFGADLRPVKSMNPNLNTEAPTQSTQVMTPMKVTSRVVTVLKTPGGQLDTLILKNGTTVKIPPERLLNLPTTVRPGDGVAISGRGGVYKQGTALEADWVIFTG